jgi:GTP:adenosylcobinamide-phosphate guanylyltransferase
MAFTNHAMNMGEQREGTWTAIVLAGQRPGEDAFAASQGVAAKALIPVGGEPMLGRVARTLLACPAVARIVVLAQQLDLLTAGELGWLASHPRIALAEAGDGISRSILNIAGQQVAPWPILVVTADHVLLTPAMVAEFLAGSGTTDIAFAVVERRVVLAAYPDAKRTWIKFSDGAFSGANLFALRRPAAARALEIWAGVEKDRKRARRLLMYFGFGLALRALTRTISLAAAARRIADRAGLTLTAVQLSQAEAAIDVDKQEDFVLATEILARRPHAPEPGRAG